MISAFLIVISFALYLIYSNNNGVTISIGVPNIEMTFYNYPQFKSDLEERFNITVDLVELYPDIQSMYLTEQDVIDNVYQKVKNGDVDMIIGLTPNKLLPLVENNLLFDMTKHLENIDNLHRGVLDSSLLGGGGSIYYISPVIKTVYFVLQNKEIFDDLGIDLLPLYPSYNDFLTTLSLLESSISENDMEYSPIAFAVRNVDDVELFIGTQLRMLGYNLKTPFYKDGIFMNEEWKEFYRFFATLIMDYGKGYEEYENGIYPMDNIFSNGKYGIMLANAFTMELYLNDIFNKEWNEQSPMNIQPIFPIEVSFLPNQDGNKIQNIRQSSLALVDSSRNMDTLLQIANYFFSEEYTLKMIEDRGKYNHFSEYPLSYPTYYSEKTISSLNQFYGENFDASLIYDVEMGSSIENHFIPDNHIDFDFFVNEALTNVYNGIRTIDESYEDILKNVKSY